MGPEDPWADLLEALEFDHATGVLRAMMELARAGEPLESIEAFLAQNGWVV